MMAKYLMPELLDTQAKQLPPKSVSWSRDLPTRWSTRHSYVLLGAMTLVCLLPFLDRAFQVDDSLFVWAGQQIIRHPFDPYGFKLIWDTNLVSMADVTKNPPLASYYAALIGTIGGWSEVSLHLGFFLPALALVLGTYRLAQRFTSSPFTAAALALLTPGVLVSASSVMCDILMLALWVWAVIFWVEGLEPMRPMYLAASALSVAACALTKYFGVALIPLLLAYSLVRTRKLGKWILCLLIPIAVLIAYQLWTQALYGRGLLWDAAQFATGQRATSGQPFVFANALMSVSFIGGCMLSALVLAPLVWSWRQILLVGVVAGIAGVAIALGWLPLGVSLQAEQVAKSLAQHWILISIQLTICIGAGLS